MKLSAGKWVATVFPGGLKRCYYIGLLPKRCTITGVNYENLLDQLRTVICEKREVYYIKMFCCKRTTRESTLDKLQWMLRGKRVFMLHPAYSHDLDSATSSYSENWKIISVDVIFGLKKEVLKWFNFRLMAYEHRWSKCITLEGNCIAKE